MKQLKQLRIVFFVLIILASCKTQENEDTIVVEGQVKNIPDGKVYLTDAHKWRIPLDSTESKGGHFIFKIKLNSGFAPHLASISFPDQTKPAKVQQLLYRNHMRKDSMQQANSAFYLAEGYTRIEGEMGETQFLRVYGSKATDAFYSN